MFRTTLATAPSGIECIVLRRASSAGLCATAPRCRHGAGCPVAAAVWGHETLSTTWRPLEPLRRRAESHHAAMPRAVGSPCAGKPLRLMIGWLNMPPLGGSPSNNTRSRPHCALVECHALAAAGRVRQAWLHAHDRRLLASSLSVVVRQGWPLLWCCCCCSGTAN